MKNIFNRLFNLRLIPAALFLLALGSAAAFAQPPGERQMTKPKPIVSYVESRVETGVSEKGVDGFRVYVSFTAYFMKNQLAQVAIRPFSGEDVLEDKDGKFVNSGGEVSAIREIKPGFDAAEYKNFPVFVPYEQLDLANGDYSLRLDIDINDANGEIIGHLAWEELEYTQGDGPEEKDTGGTKINKVWIDYDITRNGKRGMLVHVNFEVVGLKGVDAMLVMRIRKGGETYLESANAGFSNSEGEFEVNYAIKPGYDPAVYEDATIFIPYNEIIITRGTWNLELDIDLAYENGDLIKHLDFYPFEFTR